ncbi:MAG: TolC family protein [Fusobacterium sp.]|uniref:TolC family protein n=1 Tax=Fusobacterium sp. TaxID=68766 RepID=UPI0026DBF0EF|nr:TolC family protein [Fusobacterium sp.]MDO4689980.1 TolC family protein [Fusobacterium sp.]
MKKIFIIFILLNGLIFARDLTLEEAIELSLINSKDIKISEKNLEISKINLQKAFKVALPKVTYNGKYSRSNYDREIAINDKNREKGRGGYTQNITISQPLFAGGTILAGIKGAKAYENIANYSFLISKIQMRIETISAYFSLLNAEKDLVALENSKEILQKRYNKQKIQLELRLIKKSDISQTEYSLLEIESNIIAIKSQIDTYREQLRIKTGLNKDEFIKVVDFDVPSNLSKSIDIDKDLEQAINESLAAKISEEQFNISEAQSIAAAGNILPKISAFATYGTTERTKFENSHRDAKWMGGIQVTWNIFSFGSDIDDYRIAKLEKEQQKLKEISTKENIEISVKSAYFDLLRLEKLRESKSKALEVAKLNFEMDQERYDAGLISTIDYLDTENKYRNANIDYNKTLMDYYLAFEKYRSLII